MRLLFITEKFPYPLNNGGNIRTYHILKHLAKKHKVTLFSIEPEKEKEKAIPFVEKICPRVYVFPRKRRNSFWMAFYVLHSLLSRKPYPLNKNYSPLIETDILKSLKNQEFDAIHFNHIDAAMYLDIIRKKAAGKRDLPFLVFDTHNILSDLVGSMRKGYHIFPVKWFIGIQAKKIRKLEYRCFRYVNRCLVCSQEEMDKIKENQPDTNVDLIPNGVDIDHFSRRKIYPEERTPLKLVFVGAMDYYPNIDAVQFFSREVLPLILEKNLNVEFWIVGNNPGREVIALETQSSIKLVGYVADVRDYIEKAHVFVVPLRSGGGTRLKILDALAMEIPVVSTTLGAQGISVSDGENILLADSPEKMADSILRLAKEHNRVEKLRHKGRELVCRAYSWDVIGKKLLSVYPT